MLGNYLIFKLEIPSMQQPNVTEFQIPDSDSLNGSSETVSNLGSIEQMRRNVDQAYRFSDPIPERLLEKKPEINTKRVIDGIYAIGDQIESARIGYLSRMSTESLHHINDLKRFATNVVGLLFSHNFSNLSNQQVAYNNLVAKESVIGALIFGHSSSKTSRYEFFYEGRDDMNGKVVDNWFYHEDKVVGDKKEHESKTLHYEIRSDGVYLVGVGYLDDEQTDKFWQITNFYVDRVLKKIYNNDGITKSKKLSNNSTANIIRLNDNDDYGSIGRVA